MSLETVRVEEWLHENEAGQAFHFSWSPQEGFVWLSEDKDERLYHIFRGKDGIAKAVEEGLLDEEAAGILDGILKSRIKKIPFTENVIPMHLDGRHEWCNVSINNEFDERGVCLSSLVRVVKIFDMSKVLKQLLYTAEFDRLTGIYNRDTFYQKTKKLLEEQPDQKFAIICVDFDRFKIINDLFGPAKGDEVLIHVANVLKTCKEQMECYARIMQDEFGICFAYESRNEIVQLIRMIDMEIQKFQIDYRLVPGFGVYEVQNRDMPAGMMFDYAKIACNSVKGNIINNYAFYEKELRDHLMHEVEIEKDMERALRERQFKLFLQPKYDISTGHIIGAEALCRWHHPRKGIIPPDGFIPLFEKNGFIVQLDRYMWEETCRTVREWLDQGRDVKPISMNVSRMHAYNPNFENDILDLVEKYDIPSGILELELTESAYLSDEDDMYQAMERLKEHGLLFSVDDFGTGYSSLNMLKSIPVDIVKLDRGFLNETTGSLKGQAIIRNMIAMANELNIRVIAEGVESVDQAALLLEMGCELAQGYYYSKPLSLADFEKKAFWENSDVELGSAIKDVIGEKEKFFEEIQFLRGDTEEFSDSDRQRFLSNPVNLNRDLLKRIKDYRKALVGVDNILYEFNLPQHKTVVYHNEGRLEKNMMARDYEDFYQMSLNKADERYKDYVENTISPEALQVKYQQGEDLLYVSYELGTEDRERTYVRGLLLLLGEDDKKLSEILLCVQNRSASGRTERSDAGR